MVLRCRFALIGNHFIGRPFQNFNIWAHPRLAAGSGFAGLRAITLRPYGTEGRERMASSGQAAPYVAVGVRHPPLPLAYHAPRSAASPARSLFVWFIRAVPCPYGRSRRSLFMQVPGIIKTGRAIYGGRGQTFPTTAGIPGFACPALQSGSAHPSRPFRLPVRADAPAPQPRLSPPYAGPGGSSLMSNEYRRIPGQPLPASARPARTAPIKTG
jgi:hypothetical protein